MDSDHVEINGRKIAYDDWYGLYKERWNKEISGESMSHPAKFSRALIRKIYDHCIEEGWLKPGDCVIDPFGGVGLGALDAQVRGINWVGIEIEPRFYVLAMGGECDGNPVESENGGKTYSGWYIVFEDEDDKTWFLNCEAGVFEEPILDGFLSEKAAELWIASLDKEGEFDDAKNVRIEYKETVIKEIKPALCGKKTKHDPHHISGNLELWQEKYSGQLPLWGGALMIQGDSRNLVNILRDNEAVLPCNKSGAVSSPPFLQTSGGTNVTSKEGHLSDPALMKRHGAGNAAVHAYGESEGQMQTMDEGSFDTALSSPPFTGVSGDGGWQMLGNYAEKGKLTVGQVKGDPTKSYPSWDKDRDTSYGKSDGQLAEMPEGDVDAVIASPPYADIPQSGGTKGLIEHGTGLTRGDRFFTEYGEQDGQLGRMENEGFETAISSPPYEPDALGHSGNPNEIDEQKKLYARMAGARYGAEEGQIGSMKSGDLDAAISSPPFGDNNVEIGATGDTEARRQEIGGEKIKESYGRTEGQIANMPDDGYDASINSPPFESVTSDRPSPNIIAGGLRMGASSMGDGYGEEIGNIGNESGDNFWMASRIILDNLFRVLKPGAHACFVLKKYVKNRQIEDFPHKWARLCEASGFIVEHWHRAWVIESKGTQYDLWGNPVEKVIERKSFFRKLAEQKGSPRIDFEEVVCVVKPR